MEDLWYHLSCLFTGILYMIAVFIGFPITLYVCTRILYLIDYITTSRRNATERDSRLRQWLTDRQNSARRHSFVCDDILDDILRFLSPADWGAVAPANRRVAVLARRLLARPQTHHYTTDSVTVDVFSDCTSSLVKEGCLVGIYQSIVPVDLAALQNAKFLRIRAVELHIEPQPDSNVAMTHTAIAVSVRHLWDGQHVELVTNNQDKANAPQIQAIISQLFRVHLFQDCKSLGFSHKQFRPKSMWPVLNGKCIVDFEPLVPFWRTNTMILLDYCLMPQHRRVLFDWLNTKSLDGRPKCLFLQGASKLRVDLLEEMFYTTRPSRFYLISDRRKLGKDFKLGPILWNLNDELLEWRWCRVRAYNCDEAAVVIIRQPAYFIIPDTIQLDGVTLDIS